MEYNMLSNEQKEYIDFLLKLASLSIELQSFVYKKPEDNTRLDNIKKAYEIFEELKQMSSNG